MFRIQRSRPWPPEIDLQTVRDTLAYMHDDAARVPGLEKLKAALELAMKEAENADRGAPQGLPGPLAARFLPRRLY